jgi:hypothetical protein
VSISDIEDSYPIEWKTAFMSLVPKTRQAQAANFTKLRKGSIRVQARAKSTAAVSQAA